QITTTIPTCLFPGCRTPSTQCDIDHHQPWAEGGKTEPENLGPGCRHDHILKEEGGWKLQRNPNRSYTWTSRHGHTYTTRLEPP
ncbi:MAG: HNH endonuclease signature motif containing protein, partial [Acidimicrobiia bacterium]